MEGSRAGVVHQVSNEGQKAKVRSIYARFYRIYVGGIIIKIGSPMIMVAILNKLFDRSKYTVRSFIYILYFFPPKIQN